VGGALAGGLLGGDFAGGDFVEAGVGETAKGDFPCDLGVSVFDGVGDSGAVF